ncbi:DinB family protein [Algibacter amylolyticus]|uniref:DinB family protein n=1 Tax=Algibacter amylolyticus TaxID=1608400 RepID=A0A5M7B2B8_9FLAO|nr:DinB family protein [Algibacter amylolyticus]KAA5823602.1 DinB family protein [Algibacter amylolyticus]MBB5267761.1 putative damage-inducible protein DinB [Algibacter amylolyticus]TSJ74090.1 DinB family protein [Algibacter amylolyticus]
MKVTDLTANEYNPFYETYIAKVSNDITLLEGFIEAKTQVENFFKSIPLDKLEYRYAKDKWSIKEVFQHIIDNERVFMYRCFRIARHDKTPLAGYEQNDYILPSGANKKSMASLIEEYQVVRQNFIVLLKSLSSQDLEVIGTGSGSPMSARAAAFITLGHEIHHINIIKERYL